LKDRPVKEWQRPADMKAPKVEELPSLNGDGEANKEAASSDTDAKEAKPTAPVSVPKPAAPTKGFEYKREQDLRPQRPANHNQPTNRPAPPPRRPERVEIPEQLF
jgi:hypothetical protein